MKKLIPFVLILLVVGVQAQTQTFSCETYEAQVTAKIDEMTTIDGGCEVALNFFYFSEHFFCPLFEEQVTSKNLVMDTISCSRLNEMDIISGILIYHLNTNSYSVEN